MRFYECLSYLSEGPLAALRIRLRYQKYFAESEIFDWFKKIIEELAENRDQNQGMIDKLLEVLADNLEKFVRIGKISKF